MSDCQDKTACSLVEVEEMEEMEEVAEMEEVERIDEEYKMEDGAEEEVQMLEKEDWKADVIRDYCRDKMLLSESKSNNSLKPDNTNQNEVKPTQVFDILTHRMILI